MPKGDSTLFYEIFIRGKNLQNINFIGASIKNEKNANNHNFKTSMSDGSSSNARLKDNKSNLGFESMRFSSSGRIHAFNIHNKQLI